MERRFDFYFCYWMSDQFGDLVSIQEFDDDAMTP